MDLEYGKIYYVPLIAPWDDMAYGGKIVATMNINTIGDIDEFSIRNTFFIPKGIGMATYLATVRVETPIYMIQLIEQADPFRLDEKLKIFIPDSIIDHSRVYEFKIGRSVQFDMDFGGYRYFETPLDESQWARNAEVDLVKAVGNTETFIADIVSANYRAHDVLMTDADIDKFNETVKTLLTFRRDAELQVKINHELQQKEHYEQLQSMREAEKKANDAATRYNNLIVEMAALQHQLQQEALILDGCKGIMNEMIMRLRSGLMQVHELTDFITYYNKVKGTL